MAITTSMYPNLKKVLVGIVLAFCGMGVSSLHATSVLSYHYDSSSSGVNPNEVILTPANLTTTTFSKRFATTVDGSIYAQPLYVPNVTVNGGAQAGTHNLAIVATQHDSLYAIDVNSGAVVWQTSFLTTGLPRGDNHHLHAVNRHRKHGHITRDRRLWHARD